MYPTTQPEGRYFGFCTGKTRVHLLKPILMKYKLGLTAIFLLLLVLVFHIMASIE